MARPSQLAEQRRRLTPVVAQAFAALGYRRATTAQLARRCGVRENILYRLWPDKKAMFIAAIEHVFESSRRTWTSLLAEPGRMSGAQRLLSYESLHHGEFGLYRILFAGLSETDDPQILAALRRTYGGFQRFLREQIAAHRGHVARRAALEAELAAWAVVGLGTVANIGRELGLFPERRRRALLLKAGRHLLEGGA